MGALRVFNGTVNETQYNKTEEKKNVKNCWTHNIFIEMIYKNKYVEFIILSKFKSNNS